MRLFSPGGLASDEAHRPLWINLDVGEANPYSIPGWLTRMAASVTITIDSLFAFPIYVETTTTFNRIGVFVSTPGAALSVMRLGLYNASISGGVITPTSLRLDAGTVAVDSGGQKIIIISHELAAGHYYVAFSTNSTPALSSAASNQVASAPYTGQHNTIDAEPSVVIREVIVAGEAPLPDPFPSVTTGVGKENVAVMLRR
ncbi:hypothetical protein LCGC14_2141660 [marine sediment metagenome]|uniref:Uncharacterized protein n=1 Tax=marine sediment metagenome TaxID=412755 RepID=A0A0F9DY67_9ZZZZ